MSVDLHIHTLASDGRWTALQVYEAAVAAELKMIAITDHDTTRALEEAEGFAWPLGLRFVPGIEFSTDIPGHEVHVLGYGMDWRQSFFQAELALLAQSRQNRAGEMVDKLRGLGYSLKLEDVAVQAGGGSIGRPHVARALVAMGAFGTVGEVFHALLHKNGPAYVPHRRLKYPEVIELIQAAGGVAVVAHPGLAGDDELVKKVLAAGAEGLEVFHPMHTKQQQEKYLAWTQEAKLLATGGSDFHAIPGRFPEMLGVFHAPDTIACSLQRAMEKRKV
ncbi:PHP domain-containing protein [Anaeromusa acidaminophila]|uniref:PHP domain-containing protein n=1 Tax=Anaeromusa acidaminophila TaxID=81464 RepID=UPI0003651E1D|nr:PHP domain-containing protein [Anaeromusa acidaminophila]